MARNSDPPIETALLAGRAASTSRVRRQAAYKTVNKRLAIDLPYLWTDRAVWAVIGEPDGAELQQPHLAGRARPLSG